MPANTTTTFPSATAICAVSYLDAEGRRLSRIACNDRIAQGPFGNVDAFEGAQDILAALNAAEATS